MGIQDARYTVIKYAYRLRNCWKNICFISQTSLNISGKIISLEKPDELNISSIANAFSLLIQQVFKDLDSPQLSLIIFHIMLSLDILVKNINANVIDNVLVERLERLTDHLSVIVHMEYLKQKILVEPLIDQFRSEKLIS